MLRIEALRSTRACRRDCLKIHRLANGWGGAQRTDYEFAARPLDRAFLLTLHLCLFEQTTPATAGFTAALRIRRLAQLLAPACRLLV